MARLAGSGEGLGRADPGEGVTQRGLVVGSRGAASLDEKNTAVMELVLTASMALP